MPSKLSVGFRSHGISGCYGMAVADKREAHSREVQKASTDYPRISKLHNRRTFGNYKTPRRKQAEGPCFPRVIRSSRFKRIDHREDSRAGVEKKKGGTITSDQFKGPKPICTGGAFQDGGATPPTRSTPTGGLDGETGSERCLPPDPIHLSHQHYLQFTWEGKHYKFQSLPFGLISATSFYKSLKTSGGPSGTNGFMPDSVPGRYVAHAGQ